MTADADGRWLAVEVHCRGELDRLARDVLPAVEPEDAPTEWFFLRHWDGGPHLRIRVRAGSAAASGRLRSALRRHRCRPGYRPADYARDAPGLAEAEGRPGRYRRVMADEHVVLPGVYRPETGKYGSGEPLAAVEDHFVESSRLAARLLGAGLSGAPRRMLCAGALVIAWYVAGAPDTGAADPAPTVGAARTGTDDPRQRFLAEVVRIAHTHRGAPTATDVREDGPLAGWAAGLGRLARRVGSAAPNGDPAVVSVLDNVAHLFCNRVGLPLHEEHGLRQWAERELGRLGVPGPMGVGS